MVQSTLDDLQVVLESQWVKIVEDMQLVHWAEKHLVELQMPAPGFLG